MQTIEPGSPRAQGTADTEPTITDALRLLERRGYTGQFAARAGARIQCLTCRQSNAANRYDMEAMERVEGTSDPAEEAVIVGLRCPGCRAKGTFLIPFGPGGSADDRMAFAALQEGRPDHLP